VDSKDSLLGTNQIQGYRCGHGHAGRARAQSPEGACSDQGLSLPGAERNDLDLDAASPPLLPNLEWNLVPAEQVHVSVRVQECNWLQAVEGEIDSAHAPLLHGRLDARGTTSAWIQKRDLRPTFECIK
jgi:hypothetical protein